jgi:hypothetical protein
VEAIMKYGIFIMGILVMLLQACSFIPRYAVDIDSINSPGAEAKNRYVLMPGEEGVNSENLQFKEFSAYVDRALASKGFTKVDDINNADISVYLSYGIGDPQEHEFAYSFPVWGEIGYITSYRYVRVYPNTYRTFLTYTPVFGIIDNDVHTGSYTTYKRFLILDAADLAASKTAGKSIQLWQTSVTSTGTSGDLRLAFPVLLAAAKDYIGANTGKKVQVILRNDDKRVLEIKGISQ